ncbi:hypothetical protein [Kordia sp.]|uniref:hypothetical protein n=1 Tax=Kordia sp. TaxID=1965332 RepID=UPI003B59BDFB
MVLKNEEDIKKKAVEEIIKDTRLQQKMKGHNIEDFKLTCIYPYQNEGIAYELSYESEEGGYIGAVFKDGIISEVNFDTI